MQEIIRMMTGHLLVSALHGISRTGNMNRPVVLETTAKFIRRDIEDLISILKKSRRGFLVVLIRQRALVVGFLPHIVVRVELLGDQHVLSSVAITQYC